MYINIYKNYISYLPDWQLYIVAFTSCVTSNLLDLRIFTSFTLIMFQVNLQTHKPQLGFFMSWWLLSHLSGLTGSGCTSRCTGLFLLGTQMSVVFFFFSRSMFLCHLKFLRGFIFKIPFWMCSLFLLNLSLLQLRGLEAPVKSRLTCSSVFFSGTMKKRTKYGKVPTPAGRHMRLPMGFQTWISEPAYHHVNPHSFVALVL